MDAMKYNIWRSWANDYALGQSLTSRKEAEEWLIKLVDRLKEVNKGRVSNGYEALPLDGYSIVQTELDWTLDVSKEELEKLRYQSGN